MSRGYFTLFIVSIPLVASMGAVLTKLFFATIFTNGYYFFLKYLLMLKNNVKSSIVKNTVHIFNPNFHTFTFTRDAP